MKNNELSIFSKSEWNLEFRRAYESYQAFSTVSKIENEEAIKAENHSPERVNRTNELCNAYEIFCSQIIVVFCTYIEVMIKDFMYTVFQDNPDVVQRKYISRFNSSEYEKFNSKRNKNYKDICDFSILAAQDIFNFKIDEVINKICDISEKGEEKQCKDRLSKLKYNLKVVFQIRNFIIHENSIKYTKSKKENPVVIPVYKLNNFIEFIYEKLAPSLINELNTFCKNLNIEKHQEVIKNEEEAMNKLIEELLEMKIL